MNCKMPELKRALEQAGFEDVKTLLSSGNAVFSAKAAPLARLERACEAAMEQHLGRSFGTIVRSVDDLRALLESDPYQAFRLKPGTKRVVTFLKNKPTAKLELPITLDDARILAMHEREVFSAYVPSDKGPVFMALIEKTFGKEVTTRTWETVTKVAR
jgi:uncharacterized protein (DUF1697 family)